MSIRPVKRILSATPHTEGAGVKLRRAFGFGDTSELDPFLLFDDFRNDSPADYLAGRSAHIWATRDQRLEAARTARHLAHRAAVA